MALIVDASALYAHADADEPAHAEIAEILDAEPGALVTTELVVAEADYLIRERLGAAAELAFLDDLLEGTFLVECLDKPGLTKAREIVDRYRDLGVGLADASIVVVADRLGTDRLLTLDERHFRVLRPLRGGTFTILPTGRPQR
jgi:predicted nucleic acid-binding protein